ncbi:MAG: YggS family pyridoxal phosphate-dependent enzyme [Gemmatimonadota bacterium]
MINLPRIREAIEKAAIRAGRGEGEVTLVAVTKAHPPEALRAALAVGLSHLGENRVDELEGKVGLLGRGAAIWHMVGHVQSRKAKQAVEFADIIHSVDTVKLARKLSGFATEGGLRAAVLVQVNMSEEGAKSGFDQEHALEAIHEVLELPGVDVRGLMTLAPFVEDEKILRRTFVGLRKIHEEAGKLPDYKGRELSMGMTNDFELAVEEGSTMVRIGTALFGERPR